MYVTHFYRYRNWKTKIGNTLCGINSVIAVPHKNEHFEGVIGTCAISKTDCVICLKVILEEKMKDIETIKNKILELTNLQKEIKC